MAGNKANHENYGDPHLAAAMPSLCVGSVDADLWAARLCPAGVRWEEGQDKSGVRRTPDSPV